MDRIPCYLEFDERTRTVTITHAKTGCVQMKIKLEEGSQGTMTRLNPNEPCDNYWIGVKPADSVVFDGGLFTKKRCKVSSVIYQLE